MNLEVFLLSQVCPLASLLFNTILEVLATAIKGPSKRETGESVGGDVIMKAEVGVMQGHRPRHLDTSRC